MLNVLLVDDEPWVLEGLRTMINWENYGFQVCGEALNGPDALALIQKYQPELVVTDIHMPVLNGLELIEQSNQLLLKPPKFVVLSGHDDFNYIRTAMRQKVAEYLLKPIDDEEMGSLLVKLSKIITDEIEAQHSQVKQQLFAVNHIINRLIQGEYSDDLEKQARGSMKLEHEAEFQCLLIESVFGETIDLKALTEGDLSLEARHFFYDSSGRRGIIIQANPVFDSRFQEIVFQLHRELSEHLDHPVIVAVSDRMSGLRSIRELYCQSLEVGSLKRSQAKNGVFYYRDLQKSKKRKDLQQDKFRLLFDRVKAGNPGDIAASVKESFASFAENQLEIEIVKMHVADLELTVCRWIADMNGDPDTFMKALQMEHGDLGGMADYPAVKEYVYHLCVQVASHLSELRQQNESNTIFHVIQYVDSEFRNKLQLQDLARHFHMNSTYLGQLFKKNTGKPFNEYLNERRIEEAKKLLKRTQMKISDVALQVGYPNTDYFINKFKVKTGILPSVYKHDTGNKKL